MIPSLFVCPRCEEMVAERFYGPCEPCRVILRALRPPPPDPEFRDKLANQDHAQVFAL